MVLVYGRRAIMSRGMWYNWAIMISDWLMGREASGARAEKHRSMTLAAWSVGLGGLVYLGLPVWFFWLKDFYGFGRTVGYVAVGMLAACVAAIWLGVGAVRAAVHEKSKSVRVARVLGKIGIGLASLVLGMAVVGGIIIILLIG
jgi:hypothetical protein